MREPGFAAALVAALAMAACAGASASGQEPRQRSLRDALVAQDVAPTSDRYVNDEYGVRFTLERAPSGALLRFDGAYEVFALNAQAGAGGDVIYRNDAGEQVARVTSLGFVTLYTRDQPTGMLAALEGAVAPISERSAGAREARAEMARAASLPLGRARGRSGEPAESEAAPAPPADAAPMTAAGLMSSFDADDESFAAEQTATFTSFEIGLADAVAHLETRLRAETGRDVRVDVLSTGADHEGVFADAVRVATLGILEAVEADRRDPPLAETLETVEFVSAGDADVDYAGGVLVIGVAPEAGYRGRPSSARIRQALAG